MPTVPQISSRQSSLRKRGRLPKMNAKILVEYKVKNVCDESDYGKDNPRFNTFAQVVRYLIAVEGISGITGDDYRIVSIKESK